MENHSIINSSKIGLLSIQRAFTSSNSKMEAPEQFVKSVQSWEYIHHNDVYRRRRCSGVFIEQISQFVQKFPFSTLNK